MSKSHIEWTEHTWNPIVSGCSVISEGCTNCYAMKMANRLEAMGQEKYKGLTRKTQKGKILWNGKINIDMNDKALYEPLQRKKPTMYFVNSMTDLFHESVPFEAIDKIMAVIALCPQHTFQLLTKRADRMKEYFTNENYCYSLSTNISSLAYKLVPIKEAIEFSIIIDKHLHQAKMLKNLWLGVSVENQEQADKRIPYLLGTPAKVRFLSCEPLLSHIDLNPFVSISEYTEWKSPIDWVIVGGESGKDSRPMHPDWVRSIKDQCKDANTAFFFKQWGEYIPVEKKGINWFVNSGTTTYTTAYLSEQYKFDDNCYAAKVGKHKSGCLLDGQEYKEMPKL